MDSQWIVDQLVIMNKPAQSSKGLYQWTRSLHLYLGLFISPFILVYAISTLFLNHSIRPTRTDTDAATVPLKLAEGLEGQALVTEVLDQLKLSGEIGGRGVIRNNQTVIRVARPGTIKIVTVKINEQEASIVGRSTGVLGAINFLHFNPGLHRSPNWAVTLFWGWLADSVVYLTLFLTISGVYLWALMKAERKTGWIAIGSGFVTFVFLVGALFYF
jgi:hypothetical protein